MVYISYNKGHIVGFSDSCPEGYKYFVIEPAELRDLTKEIEKRKLAFGTPITPFLIIRDHRLEAVSYSIDSSEENYINSCDIPLNLIMAATRDLKTAQHDLEVIIEGRKTEARYGD